MKQGNTWQICAVPSLEIGNTDCENHCKQNEKGICIKYISCWVKLVFMALGTEIKGRKKQKLGEEL